MAVTEIWMVRHTAVKVPLGMCYGRSDVPLRETFAVEAAAVRDALEGVEFDAVWCSPLSRCTRLAGACGYGDAVRDERLLEIDFGEWEMRYFDKIDDLALETWYGDWLHARPTGGETFDEQYDRVSEFLDELLGAAQVQAGAGGRAGGQVQVGGPEKSQDDARRRVLVFTHGGVMVAAGIRAGLFEAGTAFSNLPPYGGIIKIEL